MERRVLWMAALLLIGTAGMGCGDDGGGDGDDKTGGSAGKTNQPVGGGGKIECSDPDVVCGSKCCSAPAGVANVAACCFSAFDNACGMKSTSTSPFGGGNSCTMAAETDERCPSVSLGGAGFVLESCCTGSNQCGFRQNLIFMTNDCVDIATARQRLQQMSMQFMRPDGGIMLPDGGMLNIPDGGFGMGGIQFPEPKACE